MSTANQSLASRRKKTNHAWRILALLPVIQLSENELTPTEKKWITHAKIEFSNRVLGAVLEPLAGNCAIIDQSPTHLSNCSNPRNWIPLRNQR